jgi:two-component system sensor histidine kinase QseC
MSSLQRRLIVSILIAAPIAWSLAAAIIFWNGERQISEMYDSEMMRMAEQVYAFLPVINESHPVSQGFISPPAPLPYVFPGRANPAKFAVSAWTPSGKRIHERFDNDWVPLNAGTRGFTTVDSVGQRWRVYYLESEKQPSWRVAVAQTMVQRSELVTNSIVAQLLPWVAGLPVFLLIVVIAVRAALRPLTALSAHIEARGPDDPKPILVSEDVRELRPLVRAMNRLVNSVSDAFARERRLSADAAHELRTPLAALRAQWEVAQRTSDTSERQSAQRNIDVGLDRLDRVISQLLAMARVDADQGGSSISDVRWEKVIENAISDCLSLAIRREIDIETVWPAAGYLPFPIRADEALIELMVRNLLDNAVRYGRRGSIVVITVTELGLLVENEGRGVPEDMIPRLGERFLRLPGQEETGSGLGVSISVTIAKINGLMLRHDNRVTTAGIIGFRAAIHRKST